MVDYYSADGERLPQKYMWAAAAMLVGVGKLTVDELLADDPAVWLRVHTTAVQIEAEERERRR